MKIERKFTKAGKDAYAEVEFTTTTSEIRNPDGTIVFRLDDMEVPASIVTNEANNMLQQMLRGAEIEVTQDMLDHFMEPAAKRVRSGLLLGELARQNDIVIDGAKVREAIEQVAQTYDEPREVVQMYYNDQRLLQAIENSVLENQVVDWVVNNAKVTDKAMSFQDAINAATEAAGQAK